MFMILLPEFSENIENGVVLYFSADGKNQAALMRELDTVYACAAKMGVVLKDGKKYIALEIEDEA